MARGSSSSRAPVVPSSAARRSPTWRARNPGPAGTLNAFGTYTIPAGTRIPADGILLIADTMQQRVDVRSQLRGGRGYRDDQRGLREFWWGCLPAHLRLGPLLDALGQDVNGANLDTNVAANGLAMYETGTALYPASGTVAPSLARSSLSTDTDNNRNDFHGDPSPTPGSAERHGEPHRDEPVRRTMVRPRRERPTSRWSGRTSRRT